MAFLLNKMKTEAKKAGKQSSVGQVVKTSYVSLPVDIPPSFLDPLGSPEDINVAKINFEQSTLPEYEGLYAVVLDNVLSQEECKDIIRMAECSAGAHQVDQPEPKDNGWQPAMVNAGPGREFLALDYRNSDRIIWDNKELVGRLWNRVLQGEGIAEDLKILDGNKYSEVVWKMQKGDRWVVTKQGINERMRFLKYGKEHCDGHYETPDGSQRSFFTLHLYLNDSAAALDIHGENTDDGLLRGGATTFWSRDRKRRLDVDPKAGRVLIFQHNKLLHSGDDVLSGTKYTMRSDLMYEFEAGGDENHSDGAEGGVIFG